MGINNTPLKVLIACEESQAVCKSFRELGHEAYSCDLLDCSGGHPEWHIKGDAIAALYSRQWDLVIAHPPCTRLSNSGVRWLVSTNPRDGYEWSEAAQIYVSTNQQLWKDFYSACRFFNAFILYGKIGGRIAIENPIQHSYAKEELNDTHTQVIQPYMFGHTEKKATCLWLYNLPQLVATNNVYDEMMLLPYSDRSKIHYASPGPDRAKIRSKTYSGIADAMASQWSEYILNSVNQVKLSA